MDYEVLLWMVFRADRMGKGGGVAIYTKSNLSVSLLKALSSPKQLECIALSIQLGSNSKVTVLGVYNPPSAKKCLLTSRTD